MSATLDDLAKMVGVVMVFEYTPDGKCTAYKNVSPEMAAMASGFCATVTMQFNTLAGAFSALSERPWTPQQGWIYRGGDYTVIVGNRGYRAVFAETEKADINQLTHILLESN